MISRLDERQQRGRVPHEDDVLDHRLPEDLIEEPRLSCAEQILGDTSYLSDKAGRPWQRRCGVAQGCLP